MALGGGSSPQLSACRAVTLSASHFHCCLCSSEQHLQTQGTWHLGKDIAEQLREGTGGCSELEHNFQLETN